MSDGLIADESPPVMRPTPVRRDESASSLLDYSDTSDDYRPHRRQKQQQQQQQQNQQDHHQHHHSTKSTMFGFRNDDDEALTQSMRVVRFRRDDEDDEDPPDEPMNRRSSSSPTTAHKPPPNNWVTQLAYSFRSPNATRHHRKSIESHATMREYPHYIQASQQQFNKSDLPPRSESTPLLHKSHLPPVTPSQDGMGQKKFVDIAISFLQDYEANRPPTLSSEIDTITDWQLYLYQLKYGNPIAPLILWLAALALFVSSGLEGINNRSSRYLLTGLNMVAILVLAIDMWARHELRPFETNHRHPYHARDSRTGKLFQPLILLGIFLALENWSRLIITDDANLILFASVFKPLVLFYVSHPSRNALEALRRIIRIVLRVLVMELLLILMFAAVACRLFANYDSFANLSIAWLSLFELATTVVNPSIWMPMYEASKYSAFFFIFFIVTSVFYLHSLVLSVVFQTYVQAASEIHERSVSDREDAVQLAYLALKQQHSSQQPRSSHIGVDRVREVLQKLRPHYNALKINALVDIVDPSNQHFVDYPTFRTKIRQALNASIRTARVATTWTMSVELLAVVVAMVNFIYVIMVSSAFNPVWFVNIQEIVGCAITLVAGLELLVRFNPLHIADFTPLTRLNATFDGLALVGALISCVGMALYFGDKPGSLEFIVMGRALDVIRIMRFFRIFRDIVRRSADVLPALSGPIVLVLTTLHVFVYLGMALWGGAVHIGANDGIITAHYDLNNFNSYQEGIVTMFQVLVVNDWHSIAQVFLYADRCSSPYIVFPFFVIGNLIGVSIMLNVMTAFFVEAFVTKLNDDSEEKDVIAAGTKEHDARMEGASAGPVRRISSLETMENGSNHSDDGGDADSEASFEDQQLRHFDVFEREGFDKIMQTVAGGAHDQGNYARHICDYLEVFESLSPNRESVGYLVCDQLTLERFGNRRFQAIAKGYLEVSELHVVVSAMHSELLALANRDGFQDRSLIRTCPHPLDPTKSLEISAALLRRQPALSLFVSRHRPAG